MLNAKGYGEALFLLAEERNTGDNVLADIATVSKALSDNPEYYNLADTPALPTEERVRLVGLAFGALDKDLVSLIKILCEKRMLYVFPEIAKEYGALYDESRGIERVTCVTAIEMTEKQISAVKEKLGKQLGKQIVITNIVDPKILGGMTVRYSGNQLDGSLRAGLERIEKIVKQTIVP